MEKPLAQEAALGRGLLTEIESKELLRSHGLNVVPTKLATTRSEAISLAEEIGLPAVVKIVSPDVSHKSDVGGVRVGLKTAAEVGVAYDAILAAAREHRPEARIVGVAVQPMAPPGVEVIIGMTRDPQFGPVVMFGLGGILVELLEDVSFGIVPLTRQDAREMVREIKGYPLLQGYRGRPAMDVEYLEEMLLAVARLAEEHPEIREVDLNPVFAYREAATIVDARILVQPEPPAESAWT